MLEHAEEKNEDLKKNYEKLENEMRIQKQDLSAKIRGFNESKVQAVEKKLIEKTYKSMKLEVKEKDALIKLIQDERDDALRRLVISF